MSTLDRIRQRLSRAQFVADGHWAANYATIAQMGLRLGPAESLRVLRRYPWLKTMLRVNELDRKSVV